MVTQVVEQLWLSGEELDPESLGRMWQAGGRSSQSQSLAHDEGARMKHFPNCSSKLWTLTQENKVEYRVGLFEETSTKLDVYHRECTDALLTSGM